jgi:hypothetical protein
MHLLSLPESHDLFYIHLVSVEAVSSLISMGCLALASMA